jgi:hypothetical protein
MGRLTSQYNDISIFPENARDVNVPEKGIIFNKVSKGYNYLPDLFDCLGV